MPTPFKETKGFNKQTELKERKKRITAKSF